MYLAFSVKGCHAFRLSPGMRCAFLAGFSDRCPLRILNQQSNLKHCALAVKLGNQCRIAFDF